MAPDSGVAESSRRKRSTDADYVVIRRSKRMRQLTKNCMAIGIEDTPTCASILPPGNDCTKCGATKYAYESRHFCCSDGDVHIASNKLPLNLSICFTTKTQVPCIAEHLPGCITTCSLSVLLMEALTGSEKQGYMYLSY